MLTKLCHIKQRQIKILFSQTLDIEVEGRSYHTASLGQSWKNTDTHYVPTKVSIIKQSKSQSS